MRVGIGYDVHPLVEERKLILGGVDIPFRRGLAGHSDADVLVHAMMDALLGAAGLEDIGSHFPDTDQKYKGISSIALLELVGDLVRSHGWQVSNIDSTIVAEQPKLKDIIPEMKAVIGKSLGISKEQVGIKATTSERLGFEGREEGISAYAVALLLPLHQR